MPHNASQSQSHAQSPYGLRRSRKSDRPSKVHEAPPKICSVCLIDVDEMIEDTRAAELPSDHPNSIICGACQGKSSTISPISKAQTKSHQRALATKARTGSSHQGGSRSESPVTKARSRLHIVSSAKDSTIASTASTPRKRGRKMVSIINEHGEEEEISLNTKKARQEAELDHDLMMMKLPYDHPLNQASATTAMSSSEDQDEEKSYAT